ncbi:Unannotated [Lentimonas sp. CC19]|nr:Unannotated [Lentimonas sp. CC19]CAA6694567.1 Unannotated [Lentimonas sp. CC10]CAA7072108.1 Unannotated [Lentimonas sp. CC11]
MQHRVNQAKTRVKGLSSRDIRGQHEPLCTIYAEPLEPLTPATGPLLSSY